ncbi:uroporphyrinogen-III synthase [Microbacterium esteraromaticum]|uniref:Uroporphyrinogen-III synthase n=1 Tax=Microbacterium esteraromaticum TaxID=57043 RepID=A0A939DSR9_9MICO|nr:uroporphyrinogen-III synthase [Microbacterium esteraromaticum]MBN7794238.1 uroporphyrinogen-III synthase [Microbacterium esteraromaticum]MBN8204476.1 uroporphyrinogen-III synthase [Microbacterium esteraromaticum]MBN8414630.1 uroporphyrinogen-III synthase [Microbacterium esteraromaticum]MBN8425108.1 uroporphyrinogen-III synthase [Microbacterium esteraromaticum]MCA1306685.1 uroporphyrinogen-III synthase [Microbacterium esteraromaticum]
MTASETKTARPLDGWRVLVPRGGPWGDSVAASLRSQGAVPVVAPLINFAPTTDQDALDAALARLAAGEYDWLTITSATTVDVLFAHRVEVPRSTRIAAVGETTAAALQAVGYEVALVPDLDNSAAGMAEQMIALEPDPRRVLSLRSEIAKPVLSVMLKDAGHDVDSVVAYRTVGVPVTDRIRRDVENGRINAILITSGSVAGQVREQFPEIPDSTLLAAIGPRTANDARRAGLTIAAIADKQTVDALIETVSHFTLPHAADEFAP